MVGQSEGKEAAQISSQTKVTKKLISAKRKQELLYDAVTRLVDLIVFLRPQNMILD